jgi:hypothetical protein
LDLGDRGWRSLRNQSRSSTGTGSGPTSVSSLYLFEPTKIFIVTEVVLMKQMNLSSAKYTTMAANWTLKVVRTEGTFLANWPYIPLYKPSDNH